MRLLHLIDSASAQGCPTTLALLAQSLGRLGQVHERVWLLGGGELRTAARDAGIDGPAVHHLGVPFGKAVLGFPAVRGRILAAKGEGPPDLIHCWSAHPLGAASLAAMLFPRVPRVVTLTSPPSARQVHFLRFLVQDAPSRTVLLPISATIRGALLSGGVPEPAVHVLRPGLDMGAIPHTARQELRRGWGIESDDVKVVALLSDPPEAGDAVAATWAVGLAAEAYALGDKKGPSFRLLLHPDQHHRARAVAINREIGRAGRIVTDARVATPWGVLPGCDLALALGPAAGGLSLLWAMAANIPIVAEATYAVSEVVEDRHSALLGKPDRPKALAHRISQVVTDSQLAWKLRDTARHEAFSFFSRQRYVQSLRAVYAQLESAAPIQVPAMQVTGGLRFTGRA